MTTVVIYGGRDWTGLETTFNILDKLHEELQFTLVVDGAARGADELGHQWALSRYIPTAREPAQWNNYGKAAGPIRNKLMLDKYKPSVVIGFPGGIGTSHMTRTAHKYGIEVIIPEIKS